MMAGTASRCLSVAAGAILALSLIAAEQVRADSNWDAESSTLKRILDKWKDRADRTRSLHFVSTVYCPRTPTGSFPFRLEFWLQGANLFRYDMKIADPSPKLTSIHNVWSFDGIRTAHTASVVNRNEPPHGVIVRGLDETALGDEKLIPILLTFRPFCRGAEIIRPEDFRFVTANAIRDNHHYVKIQRLDQRGVPIENLWVDPSREDTVAFWEGTQFRRDGDPIEFSIRYEHDPKLGWLPTEWKPIPERKRRGWRAVVGSNQFVLNEESPRIMFAPHFPPGTRVVDETNGEKYDVAADGSLPPAADLKIYEALENTSDFTFAPQPLSRALERIHRHFDITVAIDQKGFSDAGIDPEMEVGGLIPKIKLRELLDRVVGQCPKPIRYQVRDGVLIFEPRPRSKTPAYPARAAAPKK